jgi:hypothetical protein
MSELEVLIEGDLVARISLNKAGRLAEITYSHKAVWPHLW